MIKLKSFAKKSLPILIMLLFGFILRCYRIDNPIADWHSWRQADTASVTREFVKGGINLFYPVYHDVSSIQTGIDNPKGLRMVEFPLYNAIHAMLYKTIGMLSLDGWGRLTTSLISLISGVFLFLITKRFYGKNVGLLSMFFFLTIPFNIYFSRVILPDPLGVLFGLSGMYLFIKYIDENKRLDIIFSAILFSLSFLIKPFFVFYLLPVYLKYASQYGYFKWRKNRKLIIDIVVFVIISFSPFLLWRYWEGLHPEGIPFFKWAFNGDLIRFHLSFWKWLFWERLTLLILGGWGIVIFIVSLLGKQKNKFHIHFIMAMFLYVSVVATANIRHDYYQIIIIPAVSLAMAVGVEILFKKYKIVTLLLLILMYIVAWGKIKPFYQINHPEIIEAGKRINEITPPDTLVVAPYIGDTAFLYQTNRSGWPAVDDSIDNIILRGADYYVSVDLASQDTLNFERMFFTVEKTDKYIILDLSKRI